MGACRSFSADPVHWKMGLCPEPKELPNSSLSKYRPWVVPKERERGLQSGPM